MLELKHKKERGLERRTNDIEIGCLCEQSGATASQSRTREVVLRPVALLAVAIAFLACLAVPAYAWLSSTAEARSAAFDVSHNIMSISVEEVPVTESGDSADNAKGGEATLVTNEHTDFAEDGIFEFTAAAGKKYTVTVAPMSKTNGYFTVEIGGLEKIYVSSAIKGSESGSLKDAAEETAEEAADDGTFTFAVCLSEEELDIASASEAPKTSNVTITPYWGEFADYRILDTLILDGATEEDDAGVGDNANASSLAESLRIILLKKDAQIGSGTTAVEARKGTES